MVIDDPAMECVGAEISFCSLTLDSVTSHWNKLPCDWLLASCCKVQWLLQAMH